MAEPLQRRERWAAARNLVVYYGPGQTEQLAHYDVAVLEPLGQTADALARLRSVGTLTLAYLSVMELPPWDPVQELLDHGDRLWCDGQAAVNAEHGNLLLDLRSARWQRLLIHRAARLLSQGYDGLFLDTIGDIEAFAWPTLLRVALTQSAAAILSRLRGLYPTHLLVQNNGLGMVIERTGSLLDGVCWENPPVACRHHDYLKPVLQRIRRLAGHDRVRLVVLMDHQSADSGLLASPEILVYHASPRYLTLLPPG